MPASGGDPVTAALCLSLTASQGSQDDSSLDKRLVASSTRVLLTRIEYEPFGNSLASPLDHLKSKYIVLKSQDATKNGADTTASSTNSNMPVSNISSNQNGTMKPEPDSILPTPKVTLFPAENVQLGWRGGHYVGAGMINVGNTCYLNSTLQALFHVPALVNWLHSDNNHLSNCTVPNGTMGECIICAMNKTLKASQSKSGAIIKPFLIYNKLKFICKHLVHGQQEDAHEFMRYLLESMEKAFLSRYKGNKLDSYSKETTPLNQIFGGYIRTEVTCLQCGGVSTTFQHCQDLLLDIRRASTLDDALSAYFCKERLDGDDAYRCERCHKKVSATKKFSIEKPPQVLCIQFKRFSILGGKINKHVSFTQRLDLTRFLCPQSANKGPVPLTYRLVSMVSHVGSSVHCGHYTAVAQTSTDHFYQFDDGSVRTMSITGVLDTNAYIMLYEREPRMQPKIPPSATATSVMNGQKPSMITSPLNHKIGPTMNHKMNSMSMTNHKQISDSNFTNLSSSYTGASAIPPAKDRDRVVFGLHQTAASPAPPRLVMHIKNGKVYRPPPQPSPQQQEPSASTAASSAASLVPYCESGEDESSSSDSEPPTVKWDMPSLDAEVSPSSQNSKPVPVSNKVPTKIIPKRNFISSTGIPDGGETVPSVAAGGNQGSATSCTTVFKSVQVKRPEISTVHTSSSGIFRSTPEKISGDLKSKKVEVVSSQGNVSHVLHEKSKTDSIRTGINDNHTQSLDQNVFETSKIRKADVNYPSRSRNSSASPNKHGQENVDSWKTDNCLSEISGKKVVSSVGALAKSRQSLDLASNKEGTSIETASNLRVNVSLPTNRGKHNSGWQVTDLLLHSPSVASESSSSTNSFANSTTDWDVSDVKQKHCHTSRKMKKLAHRISFSASELPSQVVVNSDVSSENVSKPLKDEPDVNINTPWKSYSCSVLPKPPTVKPLDNGDEMASKTVHEKKRKKYNDADADDDKSDLLSSSTQYVKSRDTRDSDSEECKRKELNKKREKKLKKLKKHKKREKSANDVNEGSVSSKSDQDGYEWVEKTHETLGLNSVYRAETNGHCWDGARKSDVTNHLTHLSHRGYGTANVRSWTGERSHMDEEVERDRKEDRKRNYDNSYDEDYDRGRVKKMKHHHVDSHHKPKYNPFQTFQNYKRHWGNNSNGGGGYYQNHYYHNGNKDYKHYNNYHSRHKQYAGRSNGHHNGNKYHNYNRDRWRH